MERPLILLHQWVEVTICKTMPYRQPAHDLCFISWLQHH